jgi:hypothetical protein
MRLVEFIGPGTLEDTPVFINADEVAALSVVAGSAQALTLITLASGAGGVLVKDTIFEVAALLNNNGDGGV